MFKLFQNEVENQLNRTIKVLRSDRGGEYLSQDFLDHLRSRRTLSQLSPPRTPQHNGMSERRNRTLLDMVRSMMSGTTLPLSFWIYALLTAVLILNKAPTKKVDKTPYETWHGKAPCLSFLRVWGCEAYVRHDALSKLDPRSTKCIFVGYPKDSIGYLFYNPTENNIFVSRKAEFLESKFLSEKTSGRHVDLEEDLETLPNTLEDDPIVQQKVVEPEQPVVQDSEETPNFRKSDRIRYEPDIYGYVINGCYLLDYYEPTNYQNAI